MSARSRREAGFVLVNALVLVAALAGIAVFLLARAEGARARQAQTQEAAQLALYLDAFEALSLTILAADRAGGPADHPGEAWARARYDVPLDRGRVAGALTDLQGRFNINWLADPGDATAQAGFAALIARLGLAPGLAEEIAAFLGPGGPSNTAAYARQTPGLAPVGGPVLMLDQLLAIPALRPRDLDRLRPFIAALPGDARLNVNTAPAEVLQSMIPGLSPAVADRLVQARRLAPFAAIEEFAQALVQFGGAGLSEEDLERFGIGSEWFEARISAALGDRIRHRVTVFERRPLPEGVRVAYRLTEAP